MLTKPASATLTPYRLLAAKIRDWTPPHGLTLKSYGVKNDFLGITFKVVLSCQCEAEETIALSSVVSHVYWEAAMIHRETIVEDILDNMHMEAERLMAEHAGARA